jgi:hypothetical protein
MTDPLTMAATIWGKLEHHLVSVGMSDDRTLEIERARCIAIIAEELGAKPVKKKKATTPVEAVSEMWNDGIEKATAEKLPLIAFPPNVKPKPMPGPPPHMVKRGPSASLEDAITKRLDQIIDASINRRVGYDGDDEAGYDRR